MELTLVFYGQVPSSKNEKMPALRRRKRTTAKGAAGSSYAGFITKPAVTAAMGQLAIQIPGNARDLHLSHPTVDVEFEVARIDVDRSNIWTTIEDLLVKYGVVKDDSVSSFNGRVTLHPAKVTGHWRTLITLRCPTLDMSL